MVTKKVTKVTNKNVSKKDFKWKMNGTEYKILNVPYEQIDAEGEDFVNLDVAEKMEMIRELMLAGRIPPAVDFDLIANIDLEL